MNKEREKCTRGVKGNALGSFVPFGSSQCGFTLLELIIVFSILAILSTIGIASFVSYTKSQSLKNSTLDIKTLLLQARSQSFSQTNLCPNGNTFQGYVVNICCPPGGGACSNPPPFCTSGNDYEIDILCSSSYSLVANTGKNFPSGVSVDNSLTTNRSFHFIPITGGITQGGTIVLDGNNNATQTITVSSIGVIQ